MPTSEDATSAKPSKTEEQMKAAYIKNGAVVSNVRFVPQTGQEQDNQRTRKAIRRHVMLGKNRGPPSNPKQPKLSGSSVFKLESSQPLIDPRRSVVPPKVGTDLSFMTFADDINHTHIGETIHFCRSSAEILFILEPCIAFDALGMAKACIQLLASDPLHLNLMAFSTYAYMDAVRRPSMLDHARHSSNAGLHHYGKALSLLRERLQDPATVCPVTTMAIVALTIHSLFSGEVDRARDHAVGLQRLVSRREHGVRSFEFRPSHMIDMLRCDLSVSLATGQVPLFFSPSSNESLWSLPKLPDAQEQTSDQHIRMLNSELAEIWQILRWFSGTVNQAWFDRRKAPDQVLLDTMASTMYRLLHMSFARVSTDQQYRLAMLCFCTSAFLPWRQLQLPLPWIQDECKQSVIGLMRSDPDELQPDIAVWFVMMYGVAFSPCWTDEHKELLSWLADVLISNRLTEWEDMKDVVSGFLWIDMVCDQPAQKLLKAVLATQNDTIDTVRAST